MQLRDRLSLFLPIPLVVFNVDGMTILLRVLGLKGRPLILTAVLMAAISSFLWYRFFSVGSRLVKDPEKPALGKRVQKYLVWYEDFLKRDGWRQKMIRGGSYISLFIIGVSPEPSTRVFGVMHCAISKSLIGWIFVTAGNIVKTVGVATLNVSFWQGLP